MNVKKKLLLSIIFLCYSIYTMAQINEKKYNSLWKKVEVLSNDKGLTKSALAELEKIYLRAKKEKKEAQLIKSLIYQLNLSSTFEENYQFTGIVKLENEIKSSSEPVASILKSLLAEKYWLYFQQNRFKFYNRTATVNFSKDDIATWGIIDFHNKISSVYLSSIASKEKLQKTKLAPFDPILIKGNVRYLRPTLYDLLANRALDYFRSNERDIVKPAYAFEIKDEHLLQPAKEFSTLNIRTSDSTSLHHKALLICQELLQFHVADTNPGAFIDADITRIEIVKQYAVIENSESLYSKALEHIYSKYPTEPAAAKAAFLLAQWHASKGAQYQALNDTANRYEYLEALKICEKVIEQKQESEGKTNCSNLVSQIKRKELNLQTEKVNVVNQVFRTLVSFHNFTNLHLRIVPLTAELQKQLSNRYDEKYWKQVLALPAIRNWEQDLPDTKDYQRHNAEIKIDALTSGSYALLASINENFSLDDNPLAIQYFHVSNISYINNGDDYFVLNRDNGKPLEKASVQLWVNKYEPNIRNYVLSRGSQLVTDNNGSFNLQNIKKNNESFLFEINHKNDRLFLNDYQYRVFRGENEETVYATATMFEKEKARVFFFLDRSIYRPGQTVFFKGIAITEDFSTGKSKTYPNHQTVVKFFDVNRELLDSVKLTTNEFGCYNGSFELPQQSLNGEFSLADELTQGAVSFSVEEYKRPKFYVEYEKLKDTYKVNDSILVTGFAKAYAGNNIDGAAVKFRVVRAPRFIYPWLYWKRGMPQGSSMEIANGSIVTAADGKFAIRFKAIPDAAIDKKMEPIFDYKVIVDITDINGETRTAETVIPVSYKALQLKLQLGEGEILSIDSLKNIKISTRNLNGEFVSSHVRVSIHRLQSPTRLIRKRYWEQPDVHVISKQDYEKLFPYDEYQDENNPNSWTKTEKVYDRADSTKADNSFAINALKLAPGWYAIEVSATDKYGQELKDVQNIQLYDEKSAKSPVVGYTWNMQKNATIEPGGKSTIMISSSATDLFVIQQKQFKVQGPLFNNIRGAQKSTYSYFTLNDEKKSFDFTVAETDRGGFAVNYVFVKNNRTYQVLNTINVPWTNKELIISYETYREKTRPGSDEKWKLKISGYKNEQLAAEMLASMYDASLDQFKPHNWQAPDIWPTYFPVEMWESRNNFSAVQSQETYREYGTSVQAFYNVYDEVISFNQPNRLMIRGNAPMAAPPAANQLSDALEGKAGGIKVQAKRSMDAALPENESLAELAVVPFGIPKAAPPGAPTVQTRKNFNETAFFFPDLKTDADGNISFGFTIPEALTRWKFQALAITKEAAFGYSTKDIVTQKQLMVQPNPPRFFREGDRLELSTKIVNMSDKELTGTVHLELLNAADMQPVDGIFRNANANQYFTAGAGKSTVANFSVEVPYQYNNAVVYRFIAKSASADVSDGEEASLPVLTNSMLVTETLPLNMRGSGTKNFRFEKLLQSGTSETLQQHSLTLEFTSNPAWYAVQALPYLIEYPYDCSEQTFNRLYANAIATKIANTSPRLKAIFEKWKAAGQSTGGMTSNLQKNDELKTILLEETPWVLEAKNEAQQQKNIGLLLDMVRMSSEIESSIAKLQQSQTNNGGFSWFNGGPDDRFITQYIVTGIGRLKKLNALPASTKINDILRMAVSYLDKRMKEDYDNLVKNKTDLKQNNTGYLQVQYLYMRSFFSELGIPGETVIAATYYRKQAQQFWLQQNRYMQGMIALSLDRTGDHKTAGDILKSLQENAIVNEELGTYWKDNRNGYFWYQAPVETQSLLIEAFTEIGKGNKLVDDLKLWLLKQKQTQRWSSTKATADACYALLLQGTDWLSSEPAIEVKLGSTTIRSADEQQQAGTGYFKKVFYGRSVIPSMGTLSVTVTPGVKTANDKTGGAWGAAYWQYFEKLDKITPAATPLQLTKKLFVEKNSDRGPVLEPVTEGRPLKVGDKVKVRIELKVDRDMEYVHLKDMRASCMEPVNVLSSYKWQGGLGYYETTRDASTNFFFNWLPKGVYVFEYPLFVAQTGNFSNGISSIQCMYAPEFSSHSEGVRITVE